MRTSRAHYFKPLVTPARTRRSWVRAGAGVVVIVLVVFLTLRTMWRTHLVSDELVQDDGSPPSSNEAIRDELMSTQCDSNEARRILEESSMDPERLDELVDWHAMHALEHDWDNPLNTNCNASGTTTVGEHDGRFGGLTADMGWIMMNSMYAMENENWCAEFPRDWGHGCGGGGGDGEGWTCLFLPINYRGGPLSFSSSPPTKRTTIQHHGDQATRRRVRRDEIYTPTWNGIARYPRLSRLYPGIGRTSDLRAFKLIFRWTFRLRPEIRAEVDAIKRVLRLPPSGAYAGLHIRLGDKVGARPGPKEANVHYSLEDYARKLKLHYRCRLGARELPSRIFVATDDANATAELARVLRIAPSRVVSSSDSARDRGFSIVEYRKQWDSSRKFEAAVRLWADMELLSEAEVFLGSFQSNVGRMTHLMRFDRLANTTLSIEGTGGVSKCSRRERASQISSHNFWYCP